MAPVQNGLVCTRLWIEGGKQLFGKHSNSQLLPVIDSQGYLLGRHAALKVLPLTASEKCSGGSQLPARLSKGACPEQKHLAAMQEAGLDHWLNASGRGEIKCEERQSLSHMAASWFNAWLVVLEQVKFSV